MSSKKLTPFFFFTLLVSLFSLSITQTMAEADLATPQLAIETASQQLKEKMEDPNFLNDFGKVTTFVEETVSPHVDFNRIAALVLGKLWRSATSEEKVRFREEFQILLVRTYSRAFADFKEWSVRFLPLNMEEGDTKIVVKTEILQPGLQPISVSYRMLSTKDGWKAYDIMIEGVSLVTNYRTSIQAEYNKIGSISGVIDMLAERNRLALANQNNKS